MNRFARAAAVAALAFAGAAFAQGNFPSRPVTITVGFAPGGGTDTAARVIAKKLSENIGQSVVVENRAGAGGNIAAQHVATAPPDGYTVHLTSVGPMSVAPAMQKNLAYDVKRDIAPITMAVVFPNLFIVHPGVPAKTLKEFVDLARRRKGELSYGSSGVGGAGHLSGELFKQAAGLDMVHVPYKGGGPAMTDLLGGRIDMYTAVPSTARPHVETNKVVALATTGLKRAAIMPDVPTVAESGYPGFEATNWYAFVTSSKVPKEIQEYWNRELVKVLKDPGVAAELSKHGLEPQPGTAQELARYIESETEKWARVVREANIKAE
ncbi:MAG TPA: tripartite tricarboxylate transporter substrate binding protein [Usitatibacter sp.]|jgi:tripartite-type tricarboxylate transporter receptor subunit TctC|nr:tripartite tricarboxylate transporter substrate binding protein [Usitatibacter sp.]